MHTPPLSEDLLRLDGYATKATAAKARNIEGAINLAFGEPDFGPAPGVRQAIEEKDLNWDAFMQSSKSYEQSRGMLELRVAVADYYARRYGLVVDPEREILITHGGVEAISLAALVSSSAGDDILITDPTYMLYQRAIRTLGRNPVCLTRQCGDHEYAELSVLTAAAKKSRALIVNSPENPSGYVASQADFNALAAVAEKNDLWVIHDEVYDSMAFARPHIPARCVPGLENRSILINSFSKKYGVPGLRIGWLCAPPDVIDLAAKLHDFMYLGVNILSERFALRMISDASGDPWMDEVALMLQKRAQLLSDVMTPEKGFTWPRMPQGGMFAFPSAVRLAGEWLDGAAETRANGAGAVASDYLLSEKKIVSMPGHVYGPSSADCIRLILCSSEDVFKKGVQALRELPQI